MINLLFIIDKTYVEHLKVTLYSIKQVMKDKEIRVYLLQKETFDKNLDLEQYCHTLGFDYQPIIVPENLFANAPTTERYPDTIYYRLLAHEFLPKTVMKILYLDADILCLNDFSALYALDLGDNLYAAASHNADGKILDIVNKMRLQNFEMESSYFNTGVLLMNLEAIRSVVKKEVIFDYIAKNKAFLILPDQDILNGLYADRVLPIPDEIYNYDARYSLIYQARSANTWDIDWVMANTVFLHFAGRDKPWKASYTTRYSALYKYLANQAKDFK